MKDWVKKDKRYKQRHFIINKPKQFSNDDKQKIVVEFASRKDSGEEIAKKYDVARETIYKWQRNYIGSSCKVKIKTASNQYEDLVKENERLLLENRILKKANEILKKKWAITFHHLLIKKNGAINSIVG